MGFVKGLGGVKRLCAATGEMQLITASISCGRRNTPTLRNFKAKATVCYHSTTSFSLLVLCQA